MVDRTDVDGLHEVHGKARLYRHGLLAGKIGAPRARLPMTVTALIVAAGSGQRLGGGVPKQYRPLGGKPMLAHAVEALIGHPRIDAVRVVIGEGQEEQASAALDGLRCRRARSSAARRGRTPFGAGWSIGGRRRPMLVLIHDAARPFCPPDVIDRLLAALEPRRRGAGAAGRRHAGARRGDASRRHGRPRPTWSASRPRRPSTSSASSKRL